MLSTPLAADRVTLRRPARWPRSPSPRQAVAAVLVVAVVAVASTAVSTLVHLRIPTPTGTSAVGRVETLLTDPARTEPLSKVAAHRQVSLIAWYPATPGSGSVAAYVPDLAAIRGGLEASGELNAFQVAGLGLVATNAREGADVVAGPGLPVVLLSPGNATNVAFYAGLAEDLASHGYAVIGIDHPYQVAAVALGGGEVATYPGDAAGAVGDVPRKIDQRVADIAFVLDRLAANGAGLGGLAGRLDLSRVAIVGHSNGGIAAAQACASDARVKACVNLDGQGAGGPFSSTVSPPPPSKPFMYLTKETELHPALAALFEAGGRDTYRVVVPAAAHGDFTDGARFNPRVLPWDGPADAVLTVERGFTLAFLDHELRGAPETVFRGVDAPTDVQVSVYPLGAATTPRGPLP
jgi:dienelactone hydrolase